MKKQAHLLGLILSLTVLMLLPSVALAAQHEITYAESQSIVIGYDGSELFYRVDEAGSAGTPVPFAAEDELVITTKGKAVELDRSFLVIAADVPATTVLHISLADCLLHSGNFVRNPWAAWSDADVILTLTGTNRMDINSNCCLAVPPESTYTIRGEGSLEFARGTTALGYYDIDKMVFSGGSVILESGSLLSENGYMHLKSFDNRGGTVRQFAPAYDEVTPQAIDLSGGYYSDQIEFGEVANALIYPNYDPRDYNINGFGRLYALTLKKGQQLNIVCSSANDIDSAISIFGSLDKGAEDDLLLCFDRDNHPSGSTYRGEAVFYTAPAAGTYYILVHSSYFMDASEISGSVKLEVRTTAYDTVTPAADEDIYVMNLGDAMYYRCSSEPLSTADAASADGWTKYTALHSEKALDCDLIVLGTSYEVVGVADLDLGSGELRSDARVSVSGFSLKLGGGALITLYSYVDELTLSGELRIDNSLLNHGSLTVEPGAALRVDLLMMYGDVINVGRLEARRIQNNLHGSALTNIGLIIADNIEFEETGTLENYGTMEMRLFRFNNSSTVENVGSLKAEALECLRSSVLKNHGSIKVDTYDGLRSAGFENFGNLEVRIYNLHDSQLENEGTIVVDALNIHDTTGTVLNGSSGEITVANLGMFGGRCLTNMGSLHLLYHAFLAGEDLIENSGTIINDGLWRFNRLSVLSNSSTGVLSGDGALFWEGRGEVTDADLGDLTGLGPSMKYCRHDFDFTTGGSRGDLTTDGYSWDSELNTLSLSNVILNGAVRLPANATVVTEGNGYMFGGIEAAKGELTIGGSGTLICEDTLVSPGGDLTLAEGAVLVLPGQIDLRESEGSSVAGQLALEAGARLHMSYYVDETGDRDNVMLKVGSVRIDDGACVDYFDYAEDTNMLPMEMFGAKPTITLNGSGSFRVKFPLDTVISLVDAADADGIDGVPSGWSFSSGDDGLSLNRPSRELANFSLQTFDELILMNDAYRTYTVSFFPLTGDAPITRTVVRGETVTALSVRHPGYRFDGWLTASGERYDFSSPVDGDLELYAAWSRSSNSGGGGGSSATASYAITASAGTGGAISPAGRVNVAAAAAQSFTITAAEGYAISDVLVDGVSVGAVSTYTFSNVQAAHTIEASFTAQTPAATWDNPFTDVNTGDWFYSAVGYAYTNDLFRGNSATEFAPNESMTRAMLVTVMHRLAGTPVAAADLSAFTDLADVPDWALAAMGWGVERGVVTGTTATTLDPNEPVLREQMAAILYRYAMAEGYDVSTGAGTSLQAFGDLADLSEYATPAMQWAVGAGIIGGDDNGKLLPQSAASRAEVAAMLERFTESIVK